MIVFDLRCRAGHVFEAWFASSAAFEEQRERGLVSCPVCDDDAIEKAVMAPRLSAKGDSSPVTTIAEAKAMMAELGKAQAAALANSRWVGPQFAAEARAMHDGERTVEPIHGQATRSEAKALIADGIPVAALPLPVIPPERTN